VSGEVLPLSNRSASAFDSVPAGRRRRRLQSVVSTALSLARRALPQRCELCAACAGDALLCAACAAALPRLCGPCARCALPSDNGLLCGACLAAPPPFDATIAAFVYAFPVDRMLQRLKYGGRLALADWAAAALARSVAAALAKRPSTAWPQVIVALPLAASRQRERGFNQADAIAVRLASRLGIPLAPILSRVGSAPPQAALTWPERARNVRGAFRVATDLRNARIALVDDVMTTGATLSEAAGTLRGAGAARIECWIVARTLPPAAR
jgi:ComF family protein